MVTRNVRSAINYKLYRDKRFNELSNLQNFMNVIENNTYLIGIRSKKTQCPLETVKSLDGTSTTFKELFKSGFTVTDIYNKSFEASLRNMNQTHILPLCDKVTSHSRVLEYDAFVYIPDFVSPNIGTLESVRTKSLKRFLDKYVKTTVYEFIKEKCRQCRVKLRLEDPNEIEMAQRLKLKLENEKFRERNNKIIQRHFYIKPLESDDPVIPAKKVEMTEFKRFRKKATLEEVKKKKDEYILKFKNKMLNKDQLTYSSSSSREIFDLKVVENVEGTVSYYLDTLPEPCLVKNALDTAAYSHTLDKIGDEFETQESFIPLGQQDNTDDLVVDNCKITNRYFHPELTIQEKVANGTILKISSDFLDNMELNGFEFSTLMGP